jgi:hypothetical protein
MGNDFTKLLDFTKTANNASNLAVDVNETLIRQDIQTKYQTHLINAANNMNNDVRKLASVRLYCINKLEWEKTKSNFIYSILPIIILIVLLIVLLILSIFEKIDIYRYIYIYSISITITILWCILYNIYYKKKKLIEWNKILFNINTNNITDNLNIKDITIKSIDELYDSKYFHKLSI